MPKLKTHKGTSKRFTITKSGKIKLSHAGKRHILTKKSAKRKRHLGKTSYLKKCNTYSIKTLI